MKYGYITFVHNLCTPCTLLLIIKEAGHVLSDHKICNTCMTLDVEMVDSRHWKWRVKRKKYDIHLRDLCTNNNYRQ